MMILLSALFCGGLGGMVGESRGRGAAGAACGFLLGPLGVVIALFLPPMQRQEAAPKKRQAYAPVKGDPMVDWEAKERAKSVLPVPEHLRGREIDEK